MYHHLENFPEYTTWLKIYVLPFEYLHFIHVCCKILRFIQHQHTIPCHHISCSYDYNIYQLLHNLIETWSGRTVTNVNLTTLPNPSPINIANSSNPQLSLDKSICSLLAPSVKVFQSCLSVLHLNNFFLKMKLVDTTKRRGSLHSLYSGILQLFFRF